MYCTNCGEQIDNQAVICPKCGVAQQPTTSPNNGYAQQPNNMYPPNYNYPMQPMMPTAADTGNIGWAVLGFFFPIVGLILYLVWKDIKPFTAKAAGKGALIGVIVGVVLAILAVIFWIFIFLVIFGSMGSMYYY